MQKKQKKKNSISAVLCSNCFNDQGLRLDAESLGYIEESKCPNCGETKGRKLTIDMLGDLAQQFFVWGTLKRCHYGAFPNVQFNEHQKTCIKTYPWSKKDIELIGNTLCVGFFYYGPRFWMFGEVEPLKALQKKRSRSAIIDRIITEYPEAYLDESQLLFRIRNAPKYPDDLFEYDAPPDKFLGKGRLDSINFPVMYCSQDLEICLHECRVAAEDELYVATLSTTRQIKLLNLCHLLPEENFSEFDSLDMAIYMLFLAGEHSYNISRKIARSVKEYGFDGIIYPSYFSLLRTGTKPFETTLGISFRRFPKMQKYEQDKSVPNLALFGRPIHEGKVKVSCIDKLILTYVKYGFHFGPVGVVEQDKN